MRLSKKYIVALLASIAILNGVLSSLPTAYSQSKYPMVSFLRCTRDQAIIEAFNRMVGSSGEPSLALIVQKPVRVFFKDLSLLNKKMKNFDALSWLSVDGQQVIFINEKHRNAPPEALASIIAHEAMHDDLSNSITEEVTAWQKEAQVWQEMKRQNPTLAAIPEGEHPLVDRLNRIQAEYEKGSLEVFVRNNPGYKGLAEHSPGY
jgi:hypothetical protein